MLTGFCSLGVLHARARYQRRIPRPRRGRCGDAMKITFVSEHASPLATVGGSDCGGQNVHVAELARALGAQGHQVTVYTRHDGSSPRDPVRMCRGVTVQHVPAGPARSCPSAPHASGRRENIPTAAAPAAGVLPGQRPPDAAGTAVWCPPSSGRRSWVSRYRSRAGCDGVPRRGLTGRQLPDPDGALVRYVALMSLSPCSRAPSASRSRSTLVSGAST